MLKLISAIVPAIVAIIAGMIAFLGRKAAVLAMIIPAFLFLTAALVLCIKHVLDTLFTLVFVPTWVSHSVGLFMPSDFVFVLSSIFSTLACRWAYDKAIEKIKLLGQSN
jgi:hypothetical protein